MNWTRQPQPATGKSVTSHHKTRSVAANCWNHDLLLPSEVATSCCQVKPVQPWAVSRPHLWDLLLPTPKWSSDLLPSEIPSVQPWAVATDLLLEGRILSTRTWFWSFPVSTFHFQVSSFNFFQVSQVLSVLNPTRSNPNITRIIDPTQTMFWSDQ